MLRVKGKIRVDKKKGRVVVDFDYDFILYYNWFISKEYWVKLNPPTWGAHITIGNVIFHDNINWKRALRYNNMPIEVEYDEYVIKGGQLKNFDNYFVRAYSTQIENIKRDINVVEHETYKGMHITIGNTKNTLGQYWPQMVEFR